MHVRVHVTEILQPQGSVQEIPEHGRRQIKVEGVAVVDGKAYYHTCRCSLCYLSDASTTVAVRSQHIRC